MSARLRDLLAASKGIPPGIEYQDRLALKSSSRVMLLETKMIDWIEGAGVYVVVQVGKQAYEHRLTVGQLEQRLDPSRFLRVHRSTIDNSYQTSTGSLYAGLEDQRP